MKPKRYLFFGGQHYYPSGGWGDFLTSADSIDDKDAIEKIIFDTSDEGTDWWNGFQWLEIVDLETGERIDRELNEKIQNQILDYRAKKRQEAEDIDWEKLQQKAKEHRIEDNKYRLFCERCKTELLFTENEYWALHDEERLNDNVSCEMCKRHYDLWDKINWQRRRKEEQEARRQKAKQDE